MRALPIKFGNADGFDADAALVAARTVAAACRSEAGELDRTGVVPRASIQRFGEAGLLTGPMRGGLFPSTSQLLRALTIIGSGDLALGRLYEGHVNALLLIERFGSPTLRQRVAAVARRDNLLGVWNTDGRTPLALVAAAGSWRLVGGKSFASGAGLVAQALVTARLPDGGRQMLLLPMADMDERVDRTTWKPMGMRASMSFDVDFGGIEIDDGTFVGQPGDYLAEPWFSAGCIRFLAVQLGGAFAILNIVHDHLRQTGRADDPYQIERFARMRIAVETGQLWLDRAGATFDRADAETNTEPTIEIANMARHVVENICTLVIELAGRSIGVAGMMAPHPLERLIRDLSTYLRQPAPDAALAMVGRAGLASNELPC